jgi:hypothetical protein
MALLPLLAQDSIFRWWQLPLLIGIIALILFWRWYRNKSM